VIRLAAAAALLVLVAVTAAREDAGDAECDRYAAPAGRDAWPGSSRRPYRTVQKLVGALRPGEIGCLRGSFREDVTIRSAGITLASDPDHGRATVRGRLFVADTANGVTVRGLLLDGRTAEASGEEQLPSPTISGDRARFVDNEVTNANSGICFVLGSEDDTARATVIERNRIHHCGRLPPMNHDHGIYVALARDTVIRDNVIHANADRGVQLYPDADRTVVEHNVIDGNGTGVLFSGDAGGASSANVVRNNLITNSTVRYDVTAYWEQVVGMANVVEHNCLWGGKLGEVEDIEGFSLRGNVVADPRYFDRAAARGTARPLPPEPVTVPVAAAPVPGTAGDCPRSWRCRTRPRCNESVTFCPQARLAG
jgi:Right handed beta helix region